MQILQAQDKRKLSRRLSPPITFLCYVAGLFTVFLITRFVVQKPLMWQNCLFWAVLFAVFMLWSDWRKERKA